MAKKKDVVLDMARRARKASLQLAGLSTAAKNKALKSMAKAIRENSDKILAENKKDVALAEKMVKSGKMSKALLKRLMLDANKVEGMAVGVESVAKLPDPVGHVMDTVILDDGLELQQVTCPIGVIGAIFESRPDVVPQVSSLCLKAGNAVMFKGGSEAARSNRVLADVLSKAAQQAPGVPNGCIQLVETREQVGRMLQLDEYIDLMVPRGSNDFVRYIMENSAIPVLGHADGICHVYIHKDAPMKMALDIAFDSKVQYPAVCNALETLLVNKDIAPKFLPEIMKRYTEAGVAVRGCPRARKAAPGTGMKAATAKDWEAEYLDLMLAVRVVDDVEKAVEHINTYGSGHTEAIVTRSKKAAAEFIAGVDAACVFHNCSTRFSDGFRFGKGAEIGISTNKIHARGPVGLEGLVIYRYIMSGKGHVVADYSGENAKPFKHIRK